MTEPRASHVFGPVASRRLGRSLGVDLVPFKVCTFDCIYCQLGPTTTKTIKRDDYACVDDVVDDVRAALDAGTQPDYVTLSGSGEPTLHVHLDEVIARVKKLSDVPVALLTNGALLYRENVRRDAALADVVLPSLDAPTPELFGRINRPDRALSFENHVAGLVRFREEYAGQIWLEVFLLRGINDGEAHADAFRALIERIGPDRVHLNTAVRPTADAEAVRVSPEEMERFCERLGPTTSVVADFKGARRSHQFEATRRHVLEILSRRPCTAYDMADGLGVHPSEAIKWITELLSEGEVRAERRDGDTYYRARR